MSVLISTASTLSKCTAVLVLICALAGLFIPGFYRSVHPVLLTFYVYAYALYSFGPQYTALYPLYVAVLGLSAFALVLASLSLDTFTFAMHLRGRFPTGWIVALFGAIVISLAPVWMAMMIGAIQDGTPSLFATVHVLDLAFVFPALIAAAVGLSGRRPWSYVLAGPLLILSATMMGSLVISEIIAAVRFAPDPFPRVVTFSLIAVAATLLTHVYLRALAGEDVCMSI